MAPAWSVFTSYKSMSWYLGYKHHFSHWCYYNTDSSFWVTFDFFIPRNYPQIFLFVAMTFWMFTSSILCRHWVFKAQLRSVAISDDFWLNLRIWRCSKWPKYHFWIFGNFILSHENEIKQGCWLRITSFLAKNCQSPRFWKNIVGNTVELRKHKHCCRQQQQARPRGRIFTEMSENILHFRGFLANL